MCTSWRVQGAYKSEPLTAQYKFRLVRSLPPPQPRIHPTHPSFAFEHVPDAILAHPRCYRTAFAKTMSARSSWTPCRPRPSRFTSARPTACGNEGASGNGAARRPHSRIRAPVAPPARSPTCSRAGHWMRAPARPGAQPACPACPAACRSAACALQATITTLASCMACTPPSSTLSTSKARLPLPRIFEC